jgi:hypothetical protein
MENTQQKPLPTPVESVQYVDGTHALSVRNGVAKLDFYEAVGPAPEGEGEIRRIAHRLVLPAAAIPELADILNRALAQGK